MLVLTRKCQEIVKIILEDDREIEVIIAKVDGPIVRLGFTADKSIQIVRAELLTRPRKNIESSVCDKCGTDNCMQL